ncbi:glycosyltransferase family 4 protein [Bacillus sp. AFS096315]|uniref:glycosyltransferase family 4 protein n=1 Tax=Bacillus sp. AFS096315 TaxID=2033517 RepID=UPI000BEB7A02|nr:glycosyltransferase family 4 protein [Bacillus sp. AFS096315]PEC51940.1 glycosyl transferase [Bacillus sp. AFS096315]
MKVIMIGSHLRVTGGITRVVKNYIQAGLNKKAELEYFPTYYGGGHLINILYFIAQYVRLYIKLKVLNRKYDIAHIHMSYRGSFIRKSYIIKLLKSKNIPIVLHMHGSQFKDFYNESTDKRRRYITDTLNKVTVILALGKEWKDYYKTICETEVVSLDNAVFPKKANNGPDDKSYITTMGVLSHRKGTYDLIEAAAKLKGKIDNKYKFVLAGDGEIEKVKKKIKDLDLEDLFIIPGWISNENKIEEIYRNSIIYILPSYNEGMPMSILEAMSYGLPIISTDVGSIPSVVEKDNGFIIKPGNIDELESTILNLLNNQSDIISLRNNNIKKISTKYNIYASLDELLSLFNKIIRYQEQ